MQQVLIKRDELKFTFSFQFSSSFAAVDRHSHDTGMTPACVRLSSAAVLKLRPARELPIVVPVVEITEVDNAGGETILDELKHILIQFDLRARY